MRKAILIFLLGVLIMVSASSCAIFSDEITCYLSIEDQETSLEEASKFIGKTIPVPTYLPKNCKIQEVFIWRDYKNPLHSDITLLISDKEIEKKLVTYRDNLQRYDCKCKMKIWMDWSDVWGPGKPPCDPGKGCKLVEVWEGNKGWLDERGNSRTLEFWPGGYQPGFEIDLSASKRLLSEEELIKVAQSMTYITE